MMAAIKRAFSRFGGRNLMGGRDEKLDQHLAAQDEIERRLQAIQVEIDVQARRRLRY